MQLRRRTVLVIFAALLPGILAGALHALVTGQRPLGATAAAAAGKEQAEDSERVWLPLLLSDGASPTPSGGDVLTLTYDIDRSQLPPLYYQGLTLRLYVGPVDSLTITDSGLAGKAAPLTYTHDADSGMVTVTTSGRQLTLRLNGPEEPEKAGTYEKAALKGDAAWAWSHSLDDNRGLTPSIQALKEHGYRATLYLIGDMIPETAESNWRMTEPELQRLLGDGWSIGNHTWDHPCSGPGIGRQTVISGYNRLTDIVAGSPVPAYEVIGFAAPCFAAAYHPIIQEMIAEGITAVQYNESGDAHLLVVDPGSQGFGSGDTSVEAFTYSMPVGRDPALTKDGGLAEAKATVDWVAANHSAERHLWYNTFSHNDHADALGALAAYVRDSYGSGGSGEVWMAPADEIYSYLLVRDRSKVSLRAGQEALVDDG